MLIVNRVCTKNIKNIKSIFTVIQYKYKKQTSPYFGLSNKKHELSLVNINYQFSFTLNLLCNLLMRCTLIFFCKWCIYWPINDT